MISTSAFILRRTTSSEASRDRTSSWENLLCSSARRERSRSIRDPKNVKKYRVRKKREIYHKISRCTFYKKVEHFICSFLQRNVSWSIYPTLSRRKYNNNGTITTLIQYTYVRTYVYCTVPYCTILYCTVLYCTVLYCTVLYCTVLYCTDMYVIPYCAVRTFHCFVSCDLFI